MSIIYPLAGKRVWVAGHRGMVGAAIVRRLAREGCAEILTAERHALDLRDRGAVDAWLAANAPDAVFLAAARVGGILANMRRPADFFFDNLAIATNVIDGARAANVEKLLFLGSSCIYPRDTAQPIEESALLTGPLEPTNEAYALAKIAGLKLCQAYRRQHECDFISAMPCNLYGPGDNYSLENAHVIPALIRKAHEAKESGAPAMSVWGSGRPRREFMHVDDCADALVFLMQRYSGEEHVNIGMGADTDIASVARLVQRVVGYEGALDYDLSKPDGVDGKLLSMAKLTAMGWSPRIGLEDGLRGTYEDWRRAL